MARPRLALACLVALALAGPADGAVKPVGGSAPTGLRGFLLRADEPRSDTFARTPSFAWNPVAGAVRYEFQLSTSAAFRESGVLFADASLTTPAASIPLSLPWITGTPYSLYARVRAVTRRSVTPWSRGFGFNVRWAAVPRPLATYPGLVRWTPVEGATAYEVWWLFPDGTRKIFRVVGNVADEREWYTFHQGSAFSGTVLWRVRAIRTVYGAAANGLPAVSYGPWSPVYATANPAVTTGAMQLLGTVSDTLSTPERPAAHRIMPAFLFAGDTALFGETSELYRVYVFSDRDCLNPVHTGSVVGSPAYAPRPDGPLPLPTSAGGLATARTTYQASDGSQATFTYDARAVTPTESLPAAAPFAGGAPAAGGGEGGEGATAAGASFAPPANVGAPIDLWDTDWPRGRYFWTVVPVGTGSSVTSAGTVGQVLSPTQVVVSGGSFAVGDEVTVGTGAFVTKTRVIAVAGTTLTLASALSTGIVAGDPIVETSANVPEYRDLELAQEACAAGRVAGFGKTSEPVVTAAATPYASGLSTAGRLVAATSARPSFYGGPLVAWAPALGAGAYQLQVSRTRYPFRAAATVTTYGTSARLSLKPGVWYYRVRGLNWSVPTLAQPMSWSDPVGLRVASPTFRVLKRAKR